MRICNKLLRELLLRELLRAMRAANAGRRSLWCIPLCLPTLVAAANLGVQVLAPGDEPLSGMVVYLERIDGAASQKTIGNSAPRTIEVLQHDKQFVPYISVIQRNDQIVFNNRDDITHHIYSVTGSSRFSFKLRAGESHTESGFAEPGIVAMGCNIHDWMSGYVLVVDSDLFTLTEADGWARFTAVPASNYRVQVWHPQMQEQPQALQAHLLSNDEKLKVQLSKPLAEMPRQQALDNFDFLEGY